MVPIIAIMLNSQAGDGPLGHKGSARALSAGISLLPETRAESYSVPWAEVQTGQTI